MSDALLIAMVGAIAPTVVALVGLIVGIRNTRKTDNVEKKTDSVERKIIEVHTLQNGNLSKIMASLELAQARTEIANAKFEGLQKVISEMKAQAAQQAAERAKGK